MSLRSYPRTLSEKIADLEERVRRMRQFQAAIPNAETLSESASVTFASPVASVFGDDGAEGILGDVARADHVHDRHDDWTYHWATVAP